MEYTYNADSKELCWYRKICDLSKCNDIFCIRHYKMDALTHLATMEGKQKYAIPLQPANVDIEAYKRLRDIKNNISKFVAEGNNLLIYSKNTGNGKTEWAKKLILSWFDNIWSTSDFVCRGLFISLPRLVASMKENISKPNEYYQYVNENLLTADIVVWDEINYKEWTPYEQDFMLNIISQRISFGKSNIYTTNYRLDDVEKKLGSRLSSRIIGCSEKIEFNGSDKRGWGGNND